LEKIFTNKKAQEYKPGLFCFLAIKGALPLASDIRSFEKERNLSRPFL
jgi:hypothetical protein